MPEGPLDALPIGIILFVVTAVAFLWRKLGRKQAIDAMPALARELDLSFAPSSHAGAQGRISGRHQGYDVSVDPEHNRSIVVRFASSPPVDLRTYEHSPRPRSGWVTAYSGDREFDRFFKMRHASRALAEYLAKSERPSRYLSAFGGAYARQVRALAVTPEGVTCELDFGNPPHIPPGAIRALLPACIALASFVESGLAAAAPVDAPSADSAPGEELTTAPPPELDAGRAPAPSAATAPAARTEEMANATLEDGLAHQRAGRMAEAALAYRRILDQNPDHAPANFLLGTLALGSSRPDVALPFLERAAELDPKVAGFQANLAEAHRRLGHLPEAMEAFEGALALEPALIDAIYNLGLLLEGARLHQVAAAYFERAQELEPQNTSIGRKLAEVRAQIGASAPSATLSETTHDLALRAWFLLAQACALLGLDDAAIGHLRQLLTAAAPGGARTVPALLGLGGLLEPRGKTDEASQCFRAALEAQPDNLEALARLMCVLQVSGQLDQAIQHLRRCLEVRNVPQVRSLLLLSLPYVPGYSDAAVWREARLWQREHAQGLEARDTPFEIDRSLDRRLRIGYVSPYFSEHSHKFFLQPLLAHHDRAAVETFLYADVAQPDAESAHIRTFGDHWRETAALEDSALAELIRSDRIDVLVDLTMHAAGNRLLVFARKPAPVQLCWLAYPGTTGLASMDYRVTDRHLDPAQTDLTVYSEQSLFLPDSFWCYTPRSASATVAPLPALRTGHVTFGCLNNFVKINPGVLQLWARVMHAVAGSRLLLLVPPGDVRTHTLRVLGEAGIEAARVSFVDRRPRDEYLAGHAELDVCLDTFPCCGHTTTLDALWMGVPVVTLAGDTVIGRAGVSIAINVGLPELVARTREDFVRIAVELCSDLPRLAQLRAGLRQRLESSPLMDGPRFAANMESLYRGVWRNWVQTRLPHQLAPSELMSQ